MGSTPQDRYGCTETLKEREKEIKTRFGVKRIGLFGSFARGEQREGSCGSRLQKKKEERSLSQWEKISSRAS